MTFNLRKQALGEVPYLGDVAYNPDNPLNLSWEVAANMMLPVYQQQNSKIVSIEDAMRLLGKTPEAIMMEAGGVTTETIGEQEKALDMKNTMQNMLPANKKIKPFNLKQAQEGIGASNSKKSFKLKKAQGKNKMIKPFNLKKAYFDSGGLESSEVPSSMVMDQNVPSGIGGDQLAVQQDVGMKKFRDGADVAQWLQNETDLSGALAFTTQNDTSEKADLVKEMIEQFYDILGDELSQPRDSEIVAGQIFDYFPEAVKEGGEIEAVEKEVGGGLSGMNKQFKVINKTIKKIAQKIVNKNKKNAYNLTKTAQHKTLDQAILWGPGQTRIDPFLHQPVSDWHIVERNKGFGLVVDDIWNIDYETIWRENIMDKYSRPYKNKEGEWVGGYLNKRFETDRNIPETNNMQLKPGQLRKPILPEYGNTESRLQAARAKGDIAGALDTSKPFNWKEASKKKN